MGPTDLIYSTVKRVIRRMVRRAVGWMIVLAGVLAALWEATAAAVVALEYVTIPLYAHLIVAGAYVFLVLIVLLILLITGRRSGSEPYRLNMLRLPPELQAAAVVEALLLGFAMSRRNRYK